MIAFVFKVLVSMMILPFWALVTGAVNFPDDKIYLFAILIGFGVILYVHEKILYFLTLEEVFLTSLLASSLMLSGYLFFVNLTVPGFGINEISLGGISFEMINIPEVNLGIYGTIVLLAVISGMSYYLLMKLKSES